MNLVKDRTVNILLIMYYCKKNKISKYENKF